MDLWFVAELVLGILGNLISTFLFLSPIPTCKEIHKKRSVGKFSPIPYFAMVLSCGVWLAYGLFLNGTTRILVLTTNTTGLSLSFIYIIFFAYYAENKKRKQVLIFTTIEVVILVSIVAPIILKCFILSHDHKKKRGATTLGSLGIVANLFLYASPLSLVKDVIETRSVEYWPISTSLASFASGLVWTVYASYPMNAFILIPNILGCLLGLIQLIIYAKFKNTTKDTDRVDPNEQTTQTL
ncbi:Bidirectional sugar transporter SWEET5 [Bienertia sinuspersici]